MYRNDCYLYGKVKDQCTYKEEGEISMSLGAITATIEEAKKDDPEFYQELKEMFNT
jgi:hypothetical protein